MSTDKELNARIKDLIPKLYLHRNESEIGVSKLTSWLNNVDKKIYDDKTDDEIIAAFEKDVPDINAPFIGSKKGGRKNRKSKRSRRSRKSKRSTRSKR